MGWPELFLLVLSPGIELRGAIPYGVAVGMEPVLVGIVATALNILLVLPLFFFLDHVFPMFESWSVSQRLLRRARNAAAPYVDQYGRIGLALFVAVPLPGSGVYTGALAAYVLGIPRKSSMAGIAVGAAIAGMLVTCISAGFVPLLL